MKRYFRAVARYGARAVAFGQQRAVRFGELWRRSLQVRVVISTLALSSAVVFVLGMVLQNQITDRLLETKEEAAIAATRDSVAVAQRELIGVNPSVDAVRNRLTQALNKLTSSTPNTDTVSSSAGTFEPVLVSEAPDLGAESEMISVGPYGDVPDSLRHFVENKRLAVQIHTVDRETGRTTFLMVGVPFGNAQQLTQLYMLFPLSAEQSTIAVVQSTLLVGGLVLLLLLAGIANLVTRQVVRPVRSAAQAAERFADGELDERMIVVGEDDVARLAQSYNEMAESIQRQIRQLEEFGTLQRRFTSDVSHELRTPLTTVRMAADVLHASREQFPPGLARSTELLVDELDRFESLLGDLLEISRLDAGVEELVAEYVDVRPISMRAAQAVATIARNAGTEIILELPDEEAGAEVDARRIERILRNLLANAVDHGDGHPVRLRMAVDEYALAVTVRDYGVGLRTGEAGLVFNRFWRADPSRNRHTGGTGLGLAISLEDARLHGGGIDAWGEPGKGASFRLTLPRRQGVLYAEKPLPLPPPDADIPNVIAADVAPLSETDAVRVTVAAVPPETHDGPTTTPFADPDAPPLEEGLTGEDLMGADLTSTLTLTSEDDPVKPHPTHDDLDEPLLDDDFDEPLPGDDLPADDLPADDLPADDFDETPPADDLDADGLPEEGRDGDDLADEREADDAPAAADGAHDDPAGGGSAHDVTRDHPAGEAGKAAEPADRVADNSADQSADKAANRTNRSTDLADPADSVTGSVTGATTDLVGDPAATSTADPAVDSTTGSAAGAAAGSTTRSAADLVGDPAADSAVDSAAGSAGDLAGDPAEGPAGDPAEGLAGDPAEGPAGDPAEGPAGEPAEGAAGDRPAGRAAGAGGGGKAAGGGDGAKAAGRRGRSVPVWEEAR